MLNINELIKNAMKSKNQIELRAYKSLKAEIQVLQTAKNAKPYDDSAEIQLISKMCKKLEDAILSFSEAHREDLVSEYRNELEVLKKLLPEPVTAKNILHFILNDQEFFEKYFQPNCVQFVDEDRKSGKICVPKKEMGSAIKYLKSQFPQADGKMISDIVKKYIV